jgi:Xaa-Pro dipeptidase
MGDLHVDALLVTHLPNVRYLTGFTGSSAAALISAERTVFVTDGRYGEQARRETGTLERAISLDGLDGAIAEQASQMGARRLGFEEMHLTVAAHRRLAESLEDIELVGVDGAVEALRAGKDHDELDAIRRAQQATDEAFDRVLDVLAVGVTEQHVALELERLLRGEGASELAFDSIVAFGESAAEPHHRPGHRVLEEGDVIKLDFGARWGGYHSDMTRTVAFGSPAAELRKIHDVVRQAQEAGIDAVRAGVSCRDVDAAARSVIEDAGYGDRFGHGLGHGVGLEIHESPWLRRAGDGELPAGAVVTVEPGVYVPGLGGVRIEDMVEVTHDGSRVVGTSTRELVEL